MFVSVTTELSADEPLFAEPLSATDELEASVVVVVVAVLVAVLFVVLDWFWTVWLPSPDSEFDASDAPLADAPSPSAV